MGAGWDVNGDGQISRWDMYVNDTQQQLRDGRAAILQFIEDQEKADRQLLSDTWDVMIGSCTNPGQVAMLRSIESEWKAKYKYGILDDFDTYMDTWDRRIGNMSARRTLSAASFEINGLSAQLSIGYAFNVVQNQLGFSGDTGRTVNDVMNIIQYVQDFLSTLSAKRAIATGGSSRRIPMRYMNGRAPSISGIEMTASRIPIGATGGGGFPGFSEIGGGSRFSGRAFGGRNYSRSYDEERGGRTRGRLAEGESRAGRIGRYGLAEEEAFATRQALKVAIRVGSRLIRVAPML